MKKFFLLSLSQLMFCSALLFGQQSEQAYDFFQSDQVREIRLKFEKDNWQNSMDSLRTYGDNLLAGELTIDGKKLEKPVGVRFESLRTFKIGNKRNSYQIELDFVDKDQRFNGLQNLLLSEALRDPSMVREVLSLEIARNYMVAPQANYARFFINDEYIGLFVNMEVVDEVFLTKHFESSSNPFFKCDPVDPKNAPDGCKKNLYASLEHDPGGERCYQQNFQILSDSGWDALIDFTRQLESNPDGIESVLDVDQTLWMLAFNNVLVNLSSYSGQHSKNYYLYQNNAGQFVPIMYSMNLTFGSYKNAGLGSDLDLKGLQTLDPLLHASSQTKPLISKLLANERYKKMYMAHIRTLLNVHFGNGAYERRAKDFQRQIMVPFFNDQNKYYQPENFNKSLTSTVGQKSRIPGIVELMSKRIKFLRKYKDLTVAAPSVSSQEVVKREKFGNKRISTFKISAKLDNYPNTVTLFYRSSPSSTYQSMRMYDDGKHDDGEADDNVFGAEVNPNGDYNEIEYFILAENAGAASFYPETYRMKPLKVNLDALNE